MCWRGLTRNPGCYTCGRAFYFHIVCEVYSLSGPSNLQNAFDFPNPIRG